MIKPFLAAFVGLPVCPAFGQVPVQNSTRSFTLAEIWTHDATYNDQQNAVEFRYPKAWGAATEFGLVPPARLKWHQGALTKRQAHQELLVLVGWLPDGKYWRVSKCEEQPRILHWGSG
jgi:hypothetical protein